MVTFHLSYNEWVLFKALIRCEGFTIPPDVLLIRFIETVRAFTLTTPGAERWILSNVVDSDRNLRIGIEITDNHSSEDLQNGIIYIPNNTEYKIEYWIKNEYREEIIDGQDILLFTDLAQLTVHKQ